MSPDIPHRTKPAPREGATVDETELRRALRQLPAGDAGDGFTAEVLAKLDASERDGRQRKPGGTRFPGWASHPALGAAAAVLLAALVAVPVWLWNPGSAGTGGPQVAGDTPTPVPTAGSGEAPADLRGAAGVEGPTRELQARLPEPARADPPTPEPQKSELPKSELPKSELPKPGLPAASPQDPPPPTRLARLREVEGLLRELRRDHSRLERDLRDLRTLQAEAEGSGALYLGGDETLDLVLELPDRPPPRGGARPATLRERGPQSL